jgi:hypothetical protein
MKTRERFMGVGQVLTMPLFFASNAIYPTAIMPGWLKTVSHLNPLTYVVDALRTFMLAGSTSTFGLSHDYAVILVTAGTDPITRKPAGRDSPFGRTKSGQAHLQVRDKVATLRRGVHTNHSPTYGGIVACNLSRFDEECELFGPALAPAALLAPADDCVQGMYMGCTRDVHV